MSSFPRIWFDVSYTRTQAGGDIGITRTVRRLFTELAVAGNDCEAVAFHGTGFRHVALAPSMRPNDASGSGGLFRLITGGLARKLVPLALRTLPWSMLQALWRSSSTAAFDALTKNAEPAPMRHGDVLLLADASWNYPAWQVARLARTTGVQVVLLVYDLMPLRHPRFCFPLVPRLYRTWLAEMLACSDAVICISQATQDDVRAWGADGGFQLPPMTHFRLGSDPSTSLPASGVREAISDFIAPDAPCFAAVGSFEPKKNYALIVEAFERRWSAGDMVRLVIAGRPTTECAAMIAALRAHPQQGRLLLTVHDASDAEIAALYNQCRALVLASLFEGFGLPLVEARTRGCPVIASDLPVFRELADDGVTFFRGDSSEQLAAAVADHTRRDRRGETSPMPPFLWRDSAEQLVERVRPLLGAPAAGAHGRVDAASRTSSKGFGRPLIAGGLSSAAAVLIAVVAMPLYLRFLGPEAFGVITFVVTLQAAVLAIDAGLSIAVTRTVARAGLDRGEERTADLMTGLARQAWWIALAVTLVLAGLAPVFSQYWLKLGALDPASATQGLLLAAVSIGVRWPLALYQGVLVGSQRIVPMSVLNVTVSMAGAVGAVALVAWQSDLRLALAWFALTGMVQVAGSRHLAHQALGRGKPPPPGEVAAFFRQASSAAGLGVVGLLLMQVDKAVLSSLLPVDQFGYYVLASLMAASLYALVTPVFNVLYPHFSVLAGSGDGVLEGVYRDSTLALAAFIVPLAAVMAAFGDSILLLWTGNAQAALAGAPVVALLAAATAIHAVMFVPYALKLARGATRLALAISTTTLLLSIPATIYAALHWGAVGAAGAWLGLNVAYLVFGSIVTHRRLMPGLAAKWLALDVAPIMLCCFAAACGVASLVPAPGHSALARVAVGALTGVACWIVMACASTRLRHTAAVLLMKRNPGT